ncbi:MAG: hypothetical protein WCK98_07460 [bacterium]
MDLIQDILPPNESISVIENLSLENLFPEDLKDYLVEIDNFANWEALLQEFIDYKKDNLTPEQAKNFLANEIIYKNRSKLNESLLAKGIQYLAKKIQIFNLSGIPILIIPNALWCLYTPTLSAVHVKALGKGNFIVLPKKGLSSANPSTRMLLEHEILHCFHEFIEFQNSNSKLRPQRTLEEIKLEMLEMAKSLSMSQNEFANQLEISLGLKSFKQEFEAHFLHLDFAKNSFSKPQDKHFEEGMLHNLGVLLNTDMKKFYTKNNLSNQNKYLLINLMNNFYKVVEIITSENRFQIMGKVRKCNSFKELKIYLGNWALKVSYFKY